MAAVVGRVWPLVKFPAFQWMAPHLHINGVLRGFSELYIFKRHEVWSEACWGMCGRLEGGNGGVLWSYFVVICMESRQHNFQKLNEDKLSSRKIKVVEVEFLPLCTHTFIFSYFLTFPSSSPLLPSASVSTGQCRSFGRVSFFCVWTGLVILLS